MSFKIHYNDDKTTVRKKLVYLTPVMIILVLWFAIVQFFNTLWYGYVESAKEIYKAWKTGKV
jgi:hypothetical protein